MATYTPLTKKIIDDSGKEIVVCQYYGTKECRNIHTLNGCNQTCPMIRVMMNQLHAFEEVYLNIDGGENGRN